MDNFEEILNSLPAKSGRSRLDPYGSLIDKLLRRGRTYREIGRILAEKCNVHIAFSTIHHFVRRRSRPKRLATKGTRPKTDPGLKKIPIVGTDEKDLPAGDMAAPDDVYQRIAALKQKPASVAATAKVFHYDPDDPLRLPSKVVPRKTGG